MELDPKFDAKRIESTIRAHLQDIDIHKKLCEATANKEHIKFIEGPPTMNGVPHIGHIRGRVIKDLWYRFVTLRGMLVDFNGGWDTQGLPVELQAEKELGATGDKTQTIEQFGIDGIVNECKKIVSKYIKIWTDVDAMLGISLNHNKSYKTLDDAYIEREWQVIKRALKDGILEEDYTVIAYCPSCQTSLSHAEVAQGYEEVTDPSMYYKVKLADEDVYLVVWTTMPFTLVTDAMVGLNPDEEYAYVTVTINQNKETWIIGRTRLDELCSELKITDYTISKTVKGAEFEGRKYVHPLLDQIPGLKELAKENAYHTTVVENFVDASTGSGLVHLSPANGEEDIKIAKKRGIAIFCPIDDEARFTSQAGKYAGVYVRDADMMISENLRDRQALVGLKKIRHSYPLCWRSHHPVVWLARKGWFYKLAKMGDRATRAAESVKYFFEQPKNRFLGIIKEGHPWCISRERVWGCPLPVWDCTDCGEKTWLFSRKDIIESVATTQDLPDGHDFELHRPWIDHIRIKCSKCGGTNTCREEYVLDTWHNSGAAPWASLTDAEYTKAIPAPFFTEGIDQTRGWAYTLLVENVILAGDASPPYKSFLFQGHVLDEKGGKMSKSRGNVIEGSELVAKYPVDIIRFYLMWKASPIEPLSFGTSEMMSRPYQILGTLYNLHLYMVQNGAYDNFDPDVNTTQWARKNNLLETPDVWLLSKLQGLIDSVTRYNKDCRFHESAKALESYIIDVLSQTYIRTTRGQLWDESDQNAKRRLSIYAVLYDVLKTLDVLIHPFCPFTTEYLWQTALGKDKNRESSILMTQWPIVDHDTIEKTIEDSFDITREIVSTSMAARMKGSLKGRWPLDKAFVCIKTGQKKMLETMIEMLRGQLNVESLDIIEMEQWSGSKCLQELLEKKLPVVATAQMDRKKVGPKAKRHMPELVKCFDETNPNKIASSLSESGAYEFDIDGQIISLDTDEITIGFDSAKGYKVSRRDGCIVFVSSSRNKEMTTKGLVRDIARRLQALRKDRGYNPTDVLETGSILGLDTESQHMLKEHITELAFLVRVKSITFEESCKKYTDDDIDGQKIRISVE